MFIPIKKINSFFFSVLIILCIILQLIELRSYFDTINLLLLLFFFREHVVRDNFGLILGYKILLIPLPFLCLHIYVCIKVCLGQDLKCGGHFLNLSDVASSL